MPLLQDEQLLTMDEMASFLKVSERTVYRMMGNGDIDFAFKVNGTWRFSEADVRQWLRAQKGAYNA